MSSSQRQINSREYSMAITSMMLTSLASVPTTFAFVNSARHTSAGMRVSVSLASLASQAQNGGEMPSTLISESMPDSFGLSALSGSTVDPLVLSNLSTTALNKDAYIHKGPSSIDIAEVLHLPNVLPEKSLLYKLNVESTNNCLDRVKIVGHRGAIYDELENTRVGFQKCAEMGCDAVELDVFQLKCGTVIVFHGGGTDQNPGDLWDYCGVKGNILDLTYEEARQLRFNPNYAEFPCPKPSIDMGFIPKLEDVLMDAKKSGLHIKIELKGPNTAKPTINIVDKLNMVDQCSFSTFDLDRLAEVRRMRPQKTEAGEYLYRTGALFDNLPSDFIDQARKAGASEIHIRYDTCTPAVVSQIHDEGFGSMCWFRGPIGMSSDTIEKYWDVGNEDESMYATVLRTGVQQMCLNKPDVMLSLQKKRERLELEQDVFDSVTPLPQSFIRRVAAAR